MGTLSIELVAFYQSTKVNVCVVEVRDVLQLPQRKLAVT